MEQLRATLLCVDDDPVELALTTKTLRRRLPSWYSVVAAETLDSAQGLFHAASLDLMVLDLQLEHTSGLATIQDALSRFPLMPIVVLTGLDEDGLGNACIDAGAEDYVSKERRDPDLPRVVEFAIRRRRVARQRQENFTRVISRLASELPATGRLDPAIRTFVRQNLQQTVEGETGDDATRRIREVAARLSAAQVSPTQLVGLLFDTTESASDEINMSAALMAQLGQVYFDDARARP